MDQIVYPSPLSGTLAVMPSKSASHRAVMLAAMAAEKTVLSPLQLSKDIEATLACAKALGLSSAEIHPMDSMPGMVTAAIAPQPIEKPFGIRTLDCGESGSTLRFFIPLALDGKGPVRLIGHGRLMQRPLSLYEDLFRPLGIRWEQDGDSLTVEGQLQSGEFALRGDVSSQFITGLLLALPRLAGDSVLVLTTPLESRAYVELTRSAQALFGIISHWKDEQTLVIPGGQAARAPGHVHVESDWSHAAFYLTAGLIGDAPLSLTGLSMDSAQGDRAIVSILRGMGGEIREENGVLSACPSRLHAAVVDASQVPDLVPILAVAMAAAPGESRIVNAARLRIKESDRLAAMQRALSAAGADIAETPDGLIIRGGKPLHSAVIDGCNDHRIVMSMAVASALSVGAFTLTDAQSVAKSAPRFWEEFKSLGGKL